MLRGFRWQLLAFLLAAALFIASLALRMGETPNPTPPPASPTAPTVEATGVSLSVDPTALPVIQAPAQSSTIPTFREGLVGRVSRLNPLLASLNPVDRDITSLIFEGLVRTNAYGEPEPALASSWVISSDGLEYVVTLRDDVLWQDGIPFTADDVIYTMSLLRSPDFPGAQDLSDFWRTVETERLGDHIVRFRLTQPLGTFIDKLRVGILPEHALRGTPASMIDEHPFNLSPIGTGAYQLEALRVGDDGVIRQVDLRVAPVFRARPEGQAAPYAIERLSFLIYDTMDDALAALRANQIDGLAGRSMDDRMRLFETALNADLNTHNQIEAALGVLIFNWENSATPYFSEQRVRQALEMGIDRAPLIERNLGGAAILANSPLLPSSWAYIPNLPWPTYNPAGARSLLEQGLERLERAGELPTASESETAEESAATPLPTPSTFFSFSILTTDDPQWVNLAREIATQWSQLNLTVTIAAAPRDAYQQRLENGDFDVALVEYSLGESADPDVYAFWHQGQYPDGLNYGGVNDRRISELLERARRDPYSANRVLDYQAFQRLFVERAIALPLYYPLFTYVTHPRVQGVQLGFIGAPSDRFRNIGSWSVQ